jgi:hypothetical protein
LAYLLTSQFSQGSHMVLFISILIAMRQIEKYNFTGHYICS